MHPNERKYTELVRNSVPIADRKNTYGDIRPEVENCSNGIAPQPNTATECGKMTVPVVVSMTRFLFDHYRLKMYSHLNNCLRSGQLKRMEKQANRGAYGLMMPVRFMRNLMAEKCRVLKPYAHEGEKYEQIGLAIAKELCIPDFRVRARMIQLGHIHARGCLNYVDRRRIQPYSFDEDSLRKDEHCFNIDMRTAGHLYEKNTDFRKVLDSGKFIYADGHIVRNEPRFVMQTPLGYMLTPWAIQQVDQCCLRFTRIYEQENVGRYTYGRMNYDPDYVRQTLFYLEDLINEKELDEIEAELQFKRNFPETFLEAFDMLMKRNGDTRDTMAEKLNTTPRTLFEWLKDPDRRINADFVVTLALLWRLPDWISALLLDRAYIHFSETNRRHLALQYILKVLWSEGVDAANVFLEARKLDRLEI